MPRLLNMRDGSPMQFSNKWVRVDRGTKWGNPFRLRRRASLEERIASIEKYRRYLLEERPDLLAAAKGELRGKDLACWCTPLPCHAEILLEIANQ